MSGQVVPLKAFERVVLQSLDLLHGYALRLTSGRDAEDLVQETVLKALRARKQYRSGTNFRAWIFKIMTNLFIDMYRRKDRGPQQVSMENVLDLKSTESEAQFESLPDPETLEKILPDQMLHALDTLPDTHRTTVLLRDLVGLSYKEIAEAVECPIGTVMSRLHYARHQLKKLLASHANMEGFLPNNEE